jgi:hypothetical protein
MRRESTLIATVLGILLGTSFAHAQTPGAINLHVKETEGIRRSAYPVNGRVPFPKGALKDPSHVRLMLNDREIAAQIATESKWPDQSIQWLDIDFNATVAPLEEQVYRVEYGDEIKPAAAPRGGLMITDNADSVQVGNVRFNKNKAPLVLSIHYRQEDIGSGANGFFVTDNGGGSHDLVGSDGVKVEVVKPGPLYAVVRYTGRAAIDASYSVPFTITAEMPSGKTWVKYSVSVEDAAKRIRDVAFQSPLALTAFPWLWDFGTGSWSYGSFRAPADSVVLTQVVKPNASEWQIKNGAKGQEQSYEVAAGTRPKIAEGWGHIQDGKEVIAFGFDKFGRAPGTYTVAFDAQGQTSYRFAPAQPATHHEITIYQHYVASPTPIGAVTSPVSMLYGLSATCDREAYTKAGVPVPGAR